MIYKGYISVWWSDACGQQHSFVAVRSKNYNIKVYFVDAKMYEEWAFINWWGNNNYANRGHEMNARPFVNMTKWLLTGF
jgi:hypothetical protein